MITLQQLADAATSQGYRGAVTNTGGNVMAVTFTVHGADALISLDYGQTEGTTWGASLDGETREKHGEIETDDLPVQSDADQTIMDAAAWVKHAVWGDALADGDGPGGHMPGCGH